jgi:hypothetical protein
MCDLVRITQKRSARAEVAPVLRRAQLCGSSQPLIFAVYGFYQTV